MAKGFGKKGEFILFQPEHDDYLAFFEENEDSVQSGWSSHPSKAMKFADEELARRAARRILKDKEPGYQLIVCRLYDIGDKLAVEEVKQMYS